MPAIEQLLFNDEQIVWSGKPQFLPYMMNAFYWWAIMSLPFIIPYFLILFILHSIVGAEAADVLSTITRVLSPFLWIWICFLIGILFYNLVAYPTIKYTLTSHRVLIQWGVIGNDLQAIDRKNITSSNVIITLIDKLFWNNSGTLVFTTTMVMKPVICTNISNPYEVFTLLKS